MICRRARILLSRIVLLMVLPVAVPAWAVDKADDECENLLTGSGDAVEAGLNEYLRNNQAPALDHRRLSSELRKMSQDLVPIRKRAAQIMKNEIDYAYGKIDRKEAVARSQAERQSLRQMAQQLLAKENLSLSEHRQLEGLRVLLDRTKRVEQLSRQEIKEQMQAEQEAAASDAQDSNRKNSAQNERRPTEPSDNTENNQNSHSDETESSDNSDDSQEFEPKESAQRDSKTPPKKREPSPRDQAKDALNKHRERKPQEPTSDESESPTDPKSKAEPASEPSSEKSEESSHDEKPESADKSPDKAPSKDQESKDKKAKESKPADGKPESGKPESGEKQKSDEASESPGDDGDEAGEKGDQPAEAKDGEGEPGESDGQPGDGEAQDGEAKPGEGEAKDSEGKPGDGEAKEGKGKPGEGEAKPGQAKPSESEPGKGDGQGQASPDDPKGKGEPGKSNSQEHLGETAVEGNDGLDEGGAEADQSLLDNFNSFFKDKLKELRERLDAPKPDEKEEEASADRSRQPDAVSKAPKPKPTSDRPKESDESPSGKPYVAKPMGKRKAAMDDQKKISDTQVSNLLHRLVRRLTASSLRNYANSDSYATSLGHLQTTLISMTSEGSDDAIRQAAEEIKEIRETLAAFQVNYKDLEALGLSLLKTFDGGGHDSLRKIHFINEALTYLSKYSTLTDEEQRVLDLSRRIISLSNNGVSATDKDFCMAFINQLIGPLSKRVILEKYKVESSRDGFDFSAMAKAIRGGEFNDLLIHSSLAPYMNMLLNTSLKPKSRKVPTAERETINEQDPDLELAQELDSFQRFYRDGSPTEIDLLRFISGDMLEEVYHQQGIKNDPQTLHPKKVSFILYDVSGSMGSGNKEVLRNALILAYLDRSQREVQAGKAEHIVYLMAFDGRPHEPERVQGIGQAQATFERVRNHPMGSGGDDSITGGLVDVYRRIAERQNEGGELNRANILLITDAVAPVDFNRIENARKEIGPEVDVRLNAISMGDLNADVQKLVQMSGGEGEGKLGLVSHQHIGYQEITKILDATTKLNVLDKTLSAFDSKAQGDVENSTLIDLKNKLVMLGARRSSGDNAKLSTYNSLEKMVASEGAAGEHAHLTRGFKVFQRLALSNASAGWTRADKLEHLWAFVEDVAREMGVSGEDVMATLSEMQKQSLRHWLK